MFKIFSIAILFVLFSFDSPKVDEWKTWTMVNNWAFGVDRGEVPMVADTEALHPYMAVLGNKLLEKCKEKGIDVRIAETYRTRTKQAEYYGMGPGFTASAAGQSKHQFGLAMDVVPFVNGAAVWDNKVLFDKIGKIGEELGFRWGGRWKKPYDPGHFEWTGGLTAEQLKTGAMPEVPTSAGITNLDAKIKTLKANWEELEKYQKETYAHTLKKK